jgi:hypothetical protein
MTRSVYMGLITLRLAVPALSGLAAMRFAVSPAMLSIGGWLPGAKVELMQVLNNVAALPAGGVR